MVKPSVPRVIRFSAPTERLERSWRSPRTATPAGSHTHTNTRDTNIMAGGRGGRGNGKGGRGGRGGNTGRRVVQVVSPSQGPRKTAGGAKTLDARFTQLNRRRTEQVQRGTTARYATTMARRTGQSAKKFAVSTPPSQGGQSTRHGI